MLKHRERSIANYTLMTAVAVLLSYGCHRYETRPVGWPAQTTLPLTVPQCNGGRCECRSVDVAHDEEQAGLKEPLRRLEFRLPDGTAGALWIDIAGRGTFYRPAGDQQAHCFYIDLPPGKWPIAVHAEDRDPELPFSTGLSIFEYGGPTQRYWYPAVHFGCGGEASPCTPREMEQWTAFQRGLPGGKLNRCAGTRTRNVRFRSLGPGAGGAYKSMDLTFVLEISSAPPQHPLNSELCR